MPASDATPVPAVSVVIATYNRGNALAWALRSVLGQTRGDFEVIVVGDACTDDTAEVVASFRDARLAFVNLRRRVGDQSGPNNAGVRLARAPLVAFLNHDDLWFPDHLARLLPRLEAADAPDGVFALALEADPDGRFRVNMAYPGGGYDPRGAPPISSWIVRRDAFLRYGRFRARHRCHTIPTQDWLFRAWRAGARIEHVAAATALVLVSAKRPNAYSQRPDHEQHRWHGAIASDPALRERALAEAFSHPRPTHLRMLPTRRLAGALAMRLVARVALALNVEPEAVYFWARLGRRRGLLPRKGAVISELYTIRGIDEPPRRRP